MPIVGRDGCEKTMETKIETIRKYNEHKSTLLNSWISHSPDVDDTNFANFIWGLGSPVFDTEFTEGDA